MQKYKILTNAMLTNRLTDYVSVDYFEINRRNRIKHITCLFNLLFRVRNYDAIIAFNADIDMMIVAFMVRLITLHKTMVFFFDLNLYQPYNFKSGCISFIKSILFIGVDKFFCMHKDTSEYQRYYRIPKFKFFYVPFKPNNYSLLSKFHPRDGEYILSCGASFRDFRTFIKAVKKLGFPTKIVLPPSDIARYHNTELTEDNLPVNVEIYRHDFDPISWNEYIANARIVVIPIQKKAIQPAGISVCLEAMALCKPVIISEGASTKGILTNQEAEIVPSEDVESLVAAINKIWKDKNYRENLARSGNKYALSLEGEERLVRDILQGAYFFLNQRAKKVQKEG